MRIRKTGLALLLAGVSVLGLIGSASAATGAETFRLVFTGTFTPGASNTGTAIGTGPITAVGAGVNSGFLVDSQGHFTGSNQLRFPAGNLNIGFEGALTAPPSFDPRTCITKIAGGGTWHVTSGTGAYVATTGSGTFVNDVTLTAQPPGCTSQKEISRITLTGTINTTGGGSSG